MSRLTGKVDDNYCSVRGDFFDLYNKIGQLEDVEEKLGIDLVQFIKGTDPDTCFMEITEDGKFDLCGDAYCGLFDEKDLLEFIQQLLFMYWKLVSKTKEELK